MTDEMTIDEMTDSEFQIRASQTNL